MSNPNQPNAAREIFKNVFATQLARDEERNFQMDFVEVPPNTPLDEHIHVDVEWVYVLEGSFSDENGTYKAGDFVVFEKDSKHAPRGGKDGAKFIRCWCGTIIRT